MAEDTVSLGLLTAVFNDELRGKKMAELLELLGKIEVTKSEALAAQQAADATLLEAERKHAEARALVDQAKTHEASLVEREGNLDRAITTLNGQNEDFGRVRTQVDTDHRERESKIRGLEAKHRKWATDLGTRETEVSERERKVTEAEQKLEQRRARLAAAAAEDEAA